ncbi:MAG: UDP-2,3-diacylglucosamine diphosphatase, partial [Betaproteobacteria bacterium]|nr:UDP-2,3-diacylglucosamine diphosphatase [Betaproteobacteria bacterium]
MNGPLPYYLTTDEPSEQRYRTVFISDIHLGTAGCQATELLEFLKSFECETLYL